MEIAIRNGPVVLVFKSALRPNIVEIHEDLIVHGDFIKDVAFQVDDLHSIHQRIKEHNGDILSPPSKSSDECGSILVAKIGSCCGSLVHTLIQHIDYSGIFLPGYKPSSNFNLVSRLDSIPVCGLDHVVENHPHGALDDVTDWYNKMLNMKRFWSIDDKVVHTEFSALKALLVANSKRDTQVTLVEPVPNSRRGRGQIQECLDYHGGPGIQHIAFNVNDIIAAIDEMRRRGVEFLPIPDSYYDQLELRLKDTNLNVIEDLTEIRRLKILMDFDSDGYLLQIFTRPVQDRPTLFIEIIQRHNFNGFGAGNFKALFDAVEEEQKRRGTLLVEKAPY
uniref:4-hydroxyphenylpyruvate dioxygenase n=1 Tax=Acrobeloides nanus TaxID=290746 RepID=A0A914CRD6_9BILA